MHFLYLCFVNLHQKRFALVLEKIIHINPSLMETFVSENRVVVVSVSCNRWSWVIGVPIPWNATIFQTNGGYMDSRSNIVNQRANIMDYRGNLVDHRGNMMDHRGNLVNHRGNMSHMRHSGQRPSRSREGSVGTLVAVVMSISDLDRQVGASNTETIVISHIVLRLNVAIGINITVGSTNVAIGIAGFITRRSVRVVAESILAQLILGVILRIGRSYRSCMRVGVDMSDRSCVRVGVDMSHRGCVRISVDVCQRRCMSNSHSRGIV